MKRKQSTMLVSERRVFAYVLLFGVFVFSCKDMGSDPIRGALTATAFSVSLTPGSTTLVTISGGNPPYSISEMPNASLATASMANTAQGTGTVTIQAVNASVSGTTKVKIKDSEPHDSPGDSPSHGENEIEIEIHVSPSTTNVSFASQVQPIFTNSCVNAGCHPGGSAPFPLVAGQSWNNLVNVQATISCTSDKRVVPGNASASVLYRKISGTTCGDRMPRSLPALSQAHIDLIRDWINQGAQNN